MAARPQAVRDQTGRHSREGPAGRPALQLRRGAPQRPPLGNLDRQADRQEDGDPGPVPGKACRPWSGLGQRGAGAIGLDQNLTAQNLSTPRQEFGRGKREGGRGREKPSTGEENKRGNYSSSAAASQGGEGSAPPGRPRGQSGRGDLNPRREGARSPTLPRFTEKMPEKRKRSEWSLLGAEGHTVPLCAFL